LNAFNKTQIKYVIIMYNLVRCKLDMEYRLEKQVRRR
jgi:hypothetical protein